MLTSAAIVTASNFLIGLLGLIYQVLLGNFLTAEELAILGPLLSLLLIFTAPTNALTQIVAGTVAALHASGAYKSALSFTKRTTVIVAITACALATLVSITHPMITEIIAFSDSSLFTIFVFATFAMFPLSALLGHMQGSLLFAHQAFVMNAGIALRLLIAATLLYLSYGLHAALIAQLISVLFAIGLAYFMIRLVTPNKNFEKASQTKGKSWSANATTLTSNVITATLINGDVIVIAYLFEDSVAGNFYLLSILAKLSLFLSGGLVSVFFALASGTLNANTQGSHNLLRIAIAVSFLLSLAYSLFLYQFGGLLFEFLFVKEIFDMQNVLLVYAIGMGGLSITLILEQFALSMGRSYVLTASIIVAPIFASVLFLHGDSLFNVTCIICLFIWLHCIISLLNHLVRIKYFL